MTDFTQYEKGCSPCAIQRKYSLTYAQGYELAERLKKTRELELEVRRENAQLKERNDSLNNRDINLCRIANGIRDENFALKELLKEWVQFETEENPNDFTVMSERMSELANKTKEVLK